jgi:hypothetical protein
MQLGIDIKALSTRHSFVGEAPKYFLEVTLLGHLVRIPVEDAVVEALDDYISRATPARPIEDSPTHYEERKEYPATYETGVDYDLGTVSLSDMEEL